jgi:N-acetylmuramoyl-L-alanine amidase
VTARCPRARARATTAPLALALLVTLTTATACAGDTPDGRAAIGTGPPRPTTPTSTSPSPRPPATPAPGTEGALVTPSGVVVPVVSRDDGRWTVTTPCGRSATVSGGTPVPTATVVLDPGHGGSDPGAISPGGLAESGVNLAVSRATQRALEEAGVSTLLTRTGDYDVELLTRSQVALATSARAFVSIHHNAEPDGPFPRPGSETYYQIASADSKRLAGLIYEEVVRALSPYPVAWVADRDAGAKYRPGRRGDYYAVLRQPAPVVSVLVELAFISNQAEAELVARPEVQEVEGQAVARGILRYLNSRDPGSGFVEPYPRQDPPPAPGPPAPPCRDPDL